jgi:hypothetical protein
MRIEMRHIVPNNAIVYNDARFRLDKYGGLEFDGIIELAETEYRNPETDKYVVIFYDSNAQEWYWED